jgi:cephalosporin hydroxylase
MFPFWNDVIAPVLEAGGVKRLVEIGALRGENTRQIIETLGPETELHVIDPKPAFDPAEHEREFAGQYVFHRALSVDVLGELPAMDAALIDGDHNWYTVYNECRLLAERNRSLGAELPIMILHDVGWPYGRRDLYYSPDTVPAEFRQPYAQKGVHLDRNELAKGASGLNPNHFNATHEGGPRNGVMTGLEDWIAGYDEPVRLVVLPVYFGLAIVVAEERLARQPDLASVLDRLEGVEGRNLLLELGERLRLQAMVFQHNAHFPALARELRLVARYLGTVKAALLNEHYLEDEARLAHLAARIEAGRAPDARILRDPVRQDPEVWPRLARERLGPAGPDDGRGRSFVPYTDMGRARLDDLHGRLETVKAEAVPGDLVDVGVGRGGAGIFFRAWLDAYDLKDQKVWVVDRFRAAPEGLKSARWTERGVADFRADLNLIRDGFTRFGLLDARVKFLSGELEASLADADIEQVAMLRLGHDTGADAGLVLDALYRRIPVGGFVVVDASEESETRRSVEEFRTRRGLTGPCDHRDHGLMVWRKVGGEPFESALDIAPQADLPRAPLAPPAPGDQVDLTVVVVFHNMAREARRTLHSLSRSYQDGVDAITYEVLVIDNGSGPGQALSADLVSEFGPEFRLLSLDSIHPSPVNALNAGIRAGRGRNFALMIDGAHVVTPGVLRWGLAGLATYAPAIVATQQWYVGPGQQGDAMAAGYDREYEDRLFEQIAWPANGYRLFEISHFIGDRDWLDGLWESNCLFVARETLEQVGGFDESFDLPGAGFANLDLYERLAGGPDITVATILGEGSFHQLHGGDTTNRVDAAERRTKVFDYSQQYADLRGRAFHGPGKPVHYVGAIRSQPARRTRPRRMSAEMFNAAAAAGGVDGPPMAPRPMPEELGKAFIESVYAAMPWEDTTWLGQSTRTPPTDLVAYQEIISTVRPDWIIETGSKDGGRSILLASICELIGHGQVLSVDPSDGDGRPTHPRLEHLTGRPHHRDVAEEVHRRVAGGTALVVLGSLVDRHTTSEEFERYAPLVPVGSYVVIADTVVNGHPVWAGFGPGPAEAVKQILARNGNFAPDPKMEKYHLSFNPGGYLRRVR